jgi:hypothetical protein
MSKLKLNDQVPSLKPPHISHQSYFFLTLSTTHIKLPIHAPTILSNNGIPIQHTNANIKPYSVRIFKEK